MGKLTAKQQQTLLLFRQALTICNESLPLIRNSAAELKKKKEGKSRNIGILMMWMEAEIELRRWQFEELRLVQLVEWNPFLADFVVDDENGLISEVSKKIINSRTTTKIRSFFRKCWHFFAMIKDPEENDTCDKK